MTTAIVGGTGYTFLAAFERSKSLEPTTPYGDASGPILRGRLFGAEILFLARHGSGQPLPPHKVNYRANLAALKSLGATEVIALNAVGGIHQDMGPGQLVLVHDLIDYTYGREHTIWTERGEHLHVDLHPPYTEALRLRLKAAASAANVALIDHGVYGATQGPRLETAAEIRRMQRDGCDVVGMTGMPEAGLAREMGLSYASLCLVANWAAGLSTREITMNEVFENLRASGAQVGQLLAALLSPSP
jgi:5'-methylthioinosine phosphorylase